MGKTLLETGLAPAPSFSGWEVSEALRASAEGIGQGYGNGSRGWG